jgi:hypothetical protein
VCSSDLVNASQYSQISDFIRSLDGYGYSSDQLNEIRYILELRVMINTTKEANDMGCSVYRTSDGVNFTPVTTNGFNDKYNYGLRSFLSSANGLFMGTANPFTEPAVEIGRYRPLPITTTEAAATVAAAAQRGEVVAAAATSLPPQSQVRLSSLGLLNMTTISLISKDMRTERSNL